MIRGLIFLMLIVLPAPCYSRGGAPAVPPGSLKQLKARIDRLLDAPGFAPAFAGVRIVRLDQPLVVYERNAGKLFHPASNMKLITTAAALSLLDSSFAYRTIFFRDSLLNDGTVDGNLYVRGSGDPNLTTRDLDSVAGLLRARGIARIRGDLVGDAALFDTLAWGSGWMWDDEPDPGEAFLTPLTVNSNSVTVSVSPGVQTGAPGMVRLEPPLPLFALRNTSVTTRDTAADPLEVTRRHGENVISVGGRISPDEPASEVAISVWDPDTVFLELLRDRLLAKGIVVEGALRKGPARGVPAAEISRPIDSAVARANKISDNLAAESLLKTIASGLGRSPASAADGLEFVRIFLAGIGVDTAAVRIADGSGVSMYNLISPAAFVALLEREYRDKARFQRFAGSLAVAGIDGTLGSRMRGTPAQGNVRGKTGTISGASTLSGYVTSADGKPMAFSILLNHFPGEPRPLRALQDRILELLASFRFTKKRAG